MLYWVYWFYLDIKMNWITNVLLQFAHLLLQMIERIINTCLVLILLAVLVYSVKGCYDLIGARECMDITPPDGWSSMCGVE